MLVILVLLTFAAFIALDYFISLDRVLDQMSPVRPAVVKHAALPVEDEAIGEPVFVAGYELPQQYHYHRGHTWARVVKPETVTIGLDDFARRLVGKAETIEVPAVGSRIRQGSAAFRVNSDGRSADLVSPVEGTVLEINPAVAARPETLTEDPYRHGWVMKVGVDELDDNFRNLLSGSLAQKWMEDSRAQLELRLMALSGSVLQDGGEPSHDFAEHIDLEDWKLLVENFLLTAPEIR